MGRRMSFDEKIAEALARGLTSLSLHRIGSPPYQWQASSRWTWSGGYRVTILADPHAALATALNEQPATSQLAAAPSAVTADIDLFT
jgi:hypothetical protein